MADIAKHKWDIFFCHASEDKETVARPLANELAGLGLRVWLDESELKLGDGLRTKIDQGLASSRFGVVILSPEFFKKDWTRAELDGLVAREVDGQKVVLPVWHKVTHRDITALSPILSGRLGISTEHGLRPVAIAICSAVAAAGPRYRPGTPIFAGRLNKRTFFAFPTGSFLMSNLIDMQTGMPAIAEEIPEKSNREALWNKMRTKGATNRKAYLFSDAGEYRLHISARWNSYPPPWLSNF